MSEYIIKKKVSCPQHCIYFHYITDQHSLYGYKNVCIVCNDTGYMLQDVPLEEALEELFDKNIIRLRMYENYKS